MKPLHKTIIFLLLSTFISEGLFAQESEYLQKGRKAKSYNKRSKYLTLELQKNGPSAAYFFEMAKFNYDYSNYDVALKDFRSCLMHDPNHKGAHHFVGIIYRDEYEFDSAVVHLRKSIGDPQYDENTFWYLTDSFGGLLEWDSAHVYGWKLMKIDSTFPDYQNLYGYTCLGLGKFDRAKRCARKAHDLTVSRIDKSLYLHNWAYSLESQGHYSAAIRHYELAIEENNKNTAAKYGKGWVRGLYGDKEGALLDLKQVTQTTNYQKEPSLYYANYLHKIGRSTEALQVIDEAISRNKADPDLIFDKYLILKTLGKTKEAQECLKDYNVLWQTETTFLIANEFFKRDESKGLYAEQDSYLKWL